MNQEKILSVVKTFFTKHGSSVEEYEVGKGLLDLSTFLQQEASKLIYTGYIQNSLSKIKHVERWKPVWLSQAKEFLAKVSVSYLRFREIPETTKRKFYDNKQYVETAVINMGEKINMETNLQISGGSEESWCRFGERVTLYQVYEEIWPKGDGLPLNLWLELLRKIVVIFDLDEDHIEHAILGITESKSEEKSSVWFVKPGFWHPCLDYLCDENLGDHWIMNKYFVPLVGKNKKLFKTYLLEKIVLHTTFNYLAALVTPEKRPLLLEAKKQKWIKEFNIWGREANRLSFVLSSKNTPCSCEYSCGDVAHVYHCKPRLKPVYPIKDPLRFIIEWLLLTDQEV